MPGYGVAQAQQVLTTNGDSVANFFREASYGQQLLNVTLTPSWVTMNLPQPASCNTADWQNIGAAAEAASKALGASYDPASYQFVVYLFPTVQACGWLGLAYIGDPHKAWVNGTSAFFTQAVAHEMGHNFGLLHAASLDCEGAHRSAERARRANTATLWTHDVCGENSDVILHAHVLARVPAADRLRQSPRRLSEQRRAGSRHVTVRDVLPRLRQLQR